MFFAFSILLISVLLFDLEIVVGTIIVEDAVVPFSEKEAVFVDFCLDEIEFFREDGKSTVNIMEFISRRLQKLSGSSVRGTFAGR